MTIPFTVGGARAVIPGIYDVFRVQGSLPAAVPAGRSIMILGEAEEGVPSELLDLRLNFFTDYQSVADYYKTGSIVDAARQIFTNQPSAAFAGSVQRLYVWKTNQTTRATKTIASPSNYGSIAAARYGESGNFIKSQIKETTESLPTQSFAYLTSPATYNLIAVVNGVKSANLVVPANGTPAQVQALLDGLTGLTATGGASKATITAATDVSLAAAGDVLTITKTGGAGNFGTLGAAGDSVTIPEGSALAGTLGENAGAYLVVSWSATQVSLRQMKHFAAGAVAQPVAFDLTAVTGALAADLLLWGTMTVTVDTSAPTGAGASLELLAQSGNTLAMANLVQYSDLADTLNAANAAIGKITATVPASGQLLLALTDASWASVPAKGSLARIARGSAIEGSTQANVGMYIVTAATGSTMTLTKLYGLTTEAVSQTALVGETGPLQTAKGFVSTSVQGIKLTSSAERQVWVEASRITDGATFPATKVGGRIALELSYNFSGATACTVSIDANRVMTITPTGAGTTLEVRLNKYKTLGQLADYLSTQTGLAARVPDLRNRSLPTSVLDMVTSVAIMTGNGSHAYNGRLKMDYYDWKQLFAFNSSLLAFAEGTMNLKAGLPAAESDAGFLAGAAIGATSDADIQKGLDQGLKVDVRMVVPLFSRDARYDVSDALTDPNSSYSIDSINAAVKAHVATASSTLVKRERFGMISFHGSKEDSYQKAAEMGYERLQMTFQQFRATGTAGISWFLPWMGAVVVSAGRAQAALGTPMLRKSFGVTAVRHTGNTSIYTDTLDQDFDVDDNSAGGDLTQAIEAGLLCFRAVQGFGVRMESPDLTTRSRDNDPEAWVYERCNVLFTCDEVRQTIRTALDPYIGSRQSDVPLSVVRTAANDAIGVFIQGGSLITGQVTDIKREGTGYRAFVSITPTEALEFISLDVLAERADQGSAA